MRVTLTLALLLAAQASLAVQHEATLLLRHPALSAERLAFVHVDDIWIARRDTQLERAIAEIQGEPENYQSDIPAGASPLPTELGE